MPDEAEDHIHEVFTAAIATGTSVENPRAYLFQAVRNAMARAARRKPVESAVIPIVDPGPAPEIVEGINIALIALPKEQREVVVLRIWRDLSFQEIGHALGIPKDTAASRWRYGIAKLEVLMRKHEVIDEE